MGKKRKKKDDKCSQADDARAKALVLAREQLRLAVAMCGLLKCEWTAKTELLIALPDAAEIRFGIAVPWAVVGVTKTIQSLPHPVMHGALCELLALHFDHLQRINVEDAVAANLIVIKDNQLVRVEDLAQEQACTKG